MAHIFSTRFMFSFIFLLAFSPHHIRSQLDYRYYYNSCRNVQIIVRNKVRSAIMNDTRMGASLLRLHFHDCFVNGCDASVLLDDATNITSEKNARPNANSLRGFELIDIIKSTLEQACPATVSCADIVTLAARDSVCFVGGPYWDVPLGRKDGTTANLTGANQDLPSPFDTVSTIISKFAQKNLNTTDVVALSGGHTIGFARCPTFSPRLYNFNNTGQADPSMDPSYVQYLKTICPQNSSTNSNLAGLDDTNDQFDNEYFKNIKTNNSTSLLQSDQALLDDPVTASLVHNYGMSSYVFDIDFTASMVKMSKIGVLTGQAGQIRSNCRLVN